MADGSDPRLASCASRSLPGRSRGVASGTRGAALAFTLCLSVVLLSPAARAQSALSTDLIKLLAQIKSADTDLLAVSEADGRFLRVMAASNNAQRALEIGGANGYSAIWIGLGLRATGGGAAADRGAH